MDSALGQGTTMTVFLPEVTPHRTSLPPSSPELDHQPGTEIILLVEDEPAVRLLTQHILRTYGYTVHEAEDGFQALDPIRRGPAHRSARDRFGDAGHEWKGVGHAAPRAFRSPEGPVHVGVQR